MFGKTVAVISDNDKILLFFDLECQLLGCGVHLFSHEEAMSSKNLFSYDCLFWDLDVTVPFPEFLNQENAPEVIVISKKKETLAAYPKGLFWPASLESLEKLLSGSKRLLKRSPDETTSGSASFEEYAILDEKQKKLWIGTVALPLSDYEVKVLTALSETTSVVSRTDLNRLLGVEKGNMTDVYVCRLRKKAESVIARPLIRTVRGVGYQMNVSIRRKK